MWCVQELEGRRISVTRAVPQDQTKPGTPAAILGGGSGARREYAPRREYGRDRGYGGCLITLLYAASMCTAPEHGHGLGCSDSTANIWFALLLLLQVAMTGGATTGAMEVAMTPAMHMTAEVATTAAMQEAMGELCTSAVQTLQAVCLLSTGGCSCSSCIWCSGCS
jgi:hypothetical protein